MNAWLPQCPDTHIQIGWSFRFAKPISQHLFTYLISASTCARKSSETLSYWKCGTYLRVGEVNIAVMKSKDELSLEVKARSKIVKGTRQALNLGWCVLSRYLYVIQMILNTFPGLYFEIQVEDLEAVMWKPLEEIVDSYIKRDLIADEAILYMPVTGRLCPWLTEF